MKQGTSTLTIKRMGSFRIQTLGKHHCGTVPVLGMKYTFQCLCDVTSLDGRGFLFDQTRVDQFFLDKCKKTDFSCERLAIWCARHLFRQIREENPKCDIKWMTLTLSPEPHMAELTFEWNGETK